MSSAERKCPIWATPAKEEPTSRDGTEIISPRTDGRYFITRTAQPVDQPFEAFRRHGVELLRSTFGVELIDYSNS